jgi:hypothetical protein
MNSTKLRDQSRAAQLQLHSIYGGSLRFPTAPSSASATIVGVDAYYNENFVGRAYNWGYHNGQGRFQFNTRVDVTENQARGVACHELSHFTGLDHSSDATDCMRDNVVQMQSSSLGTAHRDQIRSAWTNSGH